MEYQDLKNGIKAHLNSAADDFFMVGYFLRQISGSALFTEDGYESIWEFAKGEYGLSASSASRFMAINARFSIDGGERMAERYVGMGVSKLQEMLGLPDEELEKVTQETTVREIRAMKKRQGEQLSFFGLPRTVRPEGSLIDTPGCGDGKYDCFDCARPCGIRQKERYCVTAPLGNPFSCTQMGGEKRLDIEAGLFRDKCQHLHPELAPIRGGDKEPLPCCRDCEHKTCFSRCDVATKKDEDERKKEREELQRRQKEAEAGKPVMSQGEIESLYGWLEIKPEDEVTGSWLKERHGRSYHGGGCGMHYFHCTPCGVKTNRSKEMTWGQAAKSLKEVQEKKKELAELAERQKREDEEKRADKKEDILIFGFYKGMHPGARQTVSQRNNAAITKELKDVYGRAYKDGKGWRAYPDKIVFQDKPGAEQLQITWGRFTTRLVRLLDRFPEVERSALARDKTEQKKPDIVDADCWEAEDEPDLEEIIPQEPEAEAEPNPEEYDRIDVALLLDKYNRDLRAYREAFSKEDCPPPIIQKQRIIVDALTILLERMDEGGEED